ncbi:MAG: peptidoglycan DD-metalloendopeptidase family protein [Alphaproteobacteria bacterium]
MGTCKYVYGRHVWVKRVASLCGVIVLLPLAGCSSDSTRFGDNDAHSGYKTTNSVPVPSEPVYGYRYGNGYTNSTAEYAGYGGNGSRGGSSHAPFTSSLSVAQVSGPEPVQRSRLAPASGSHSKSYKRYAMNTHSNVKSDAYSGGTYAMMAADSSASSGKAKSDDRLAYNDYRSSRRSRRYYKNDRNDRYRNDAYSDGDLKNGDYLRNGHSSRDNGDRNGHSRHETRGDDYVVQPGDTLFAIGKQFHLSADQLMTLNNLRSTEIYPGQRLRVSGYGYTGANGSDRPSRYGPDYRNGYGNYDGDYRHDNRSANRSGSRVRSRSRGQGKDYPKTRSAYNYDDFASHRSERRNRYYDRQNGYNDRRRDRRDDSARSRKRYEDEYQGAPRKRRQRARPSSHENGGYARNSHDSASRRDAIRYTIKRGDTLFDIARRNGISHRELADFNGIRISDTLMPGQLLLIPRGRGYDWSADRLPSEKRRRDRWGAKQQDKQAPRKASREVAENREKKDEPSKSENKAVALAEERQADRANAPVEPKTSSAVATAAPVQIVGGHKETSAPVKPADKAKLSAKECESLLANPAPRSAKTFREPVQGMVITKFGKKEDGTFSDGINFSVPKGTPVKAAENGVVAYAGSELSGFGNLVLIRHADGYVTAYAHNDKLAVRKCDVVKRGQVIGRAGATGNTTKPQLHFELRKGSKPVDPQAHFSRS